MKGLQGIKTTKNGILIMSTVRNCSEAYLQQLMLLIIIRIKNKNFCLSNQIATTIRLLFSKNYLQPGLTLNTYQWEI